MEQRTFFNQSLSWNPTTWLGNKLIRLVVIFFGAFLSIFWLSLSPIGANTSANIQFVSPSWVEENADWKVLDVRINPLQYIEGHIPNAVNVADNIFRGPDGFLPVQYWDSEKIVDLFAKAGISNDDKVIVYSDDVNILGATMVAYLSERSGVEDIAVVDGGYKGYVNDNKTVTKEFLSYELGRFSLRDNTSVRVDLNELQTLIGKQGVVIIDPRPADLFEGKINLWVRNGHIPGAKNIPWQTFTEANNADETLKNPHKLKSLDDIKEILASRNIQPTDNIIVSCSTGREATLQYVVLKHLLGYPNVRIYEGSWTEYSSTNLPIETGPEKTI
ncbi:sulfurtransferase [Cyanobacterium sp. IPPAS B-1200]|uniref:sulfurtransferase n=1 Tax=Cyanobacterium sp. IPPAS B-1200 TaxID=1562720 RepID=UPI0008524CA0|nr:sulfurtransferase [Cyanobacterium sp. IPPAS B-1200]OEJ77863.1 thiosulfate sulfurtransferase [Cyanobacterium sp. IPPAS B-1200]